MVSHDQVNGFSVFVGKDLFSKFESNFFKYSTNKKRANSPQVLSPTNGLSSSNMKREYVIENQIFHGKQQVISSKIDLL